MPPEIYEKYQDLRRAGQIGRIWPAEQGAGFLLSQEPTHLYTSAEPISRQDLYELIDPGYMAPEASAPQYLIARKSAASETRGVLRFVRIG